MRPSPLPRREFIKRSLAAALGSGLAASSPARAQLPAARARKPNILVVMTDQQNIDTIAAHRSYFDHPAYGSNWVKTPNLDRLAARGVSFLESHSANPVCSPGRSCLFTGRMATETGVVQNNFGIDPKVPNMGEWFSENGDYDCYYCGKWHAGGPWNYPEIRGRRKIPGFSTVPVGGAPTGDLVDYSVSSSTQAFLREYRRDTPFLYVASLMNPHDICYWIEPLGGAVITRNRDYYNLGDALPPLPPNNGDEVDDPQKWRRQTQWKEQDWRNYAYDYYRMIEKVDADVGRILDALDERDDETLIFFTSDHGEGLGRHQRVQKWHPFNHSAKVPLIVAGAGVSRPGQVDASHLVFGPDIFATACEAAGIPLPPHCRGRSLGPILRGDLVDDWRDSVCFEFQITGRALRTQRYKYVVMRERTNREAFECFYDLDEDPWEMKNRIDEPRLSDLIRDHRRILSEQWESRWIPGTPKTIPN